MSADLGLDALDGVGNLIADTASVGLDSLDRLPGGLATRRQPGEQPLPALWAMNRVQEVDESATDGSGTDKLGQIDRRWASIESLRPVTAHCLGHAANDWPRGLSCLGGYPTSLHRATPILSPKREQALTSLLAQLGIEEVDGEAAQRRAHG